MRKIYLSWHYVSHGIAYLKHVLSRFYEDSELPAGEIDWAGLRQHELDRRFDAAPGRGFVFDEVHYLYPPQATLDRITGRLYRSDTLFQDKELEAAGTFDIWREVVARDHVALADGLPRNLEANLDYVATMHPARAGLFAQQVWRHIHHYSVEDQVWWLQEQSNFGKAYGKGSFRPHCFEGLQDLRDAEAIAAVLVPYLSAILERGGEAEFVINLSLCTSETQIVWYVLVQSLLLRPERVRFVQTYDDKTGDAGDSRFKPFHIKQVPATLLSKADSILESNKASHSLLRQKAGRRLELYLDSGFSVLLLGERGTGKSSLVEGVVKEAARPAGPDKETAKKVVVANCAAFDSDSKAEAELFGYKKGAFTGANADHAGLFKEANGGVLFLDEAHHLQKAVQAKLMRALQTDDNNKMRIRRLGDGQEQLVTCRVVFASNRSIAELRDKFFFPDFFDRVVQQVLELPPLRDTPEDRVRNWENIWTQMKFKHACPKRKDFLDWLKQERLPGNFRDLQRIAIHYNNWLSMKYGKYKDLLDNSGADDELAYVKREYYRAYAQDPDSPYSSFDREKEPKALVAEFKKNLADWAEREFGTLQAAAKYYAVQGFDISQATLYKWKKGE